MLQRLFSLICLLWTASLLAQSIPTSITDLLQEIRSLEKPKRVLYIAAHPDDENTRLIAWLTHGAAVQTAYLSLTRGDGGQNLIGPELGAPLGFIRTQELIEARKIDGGTQFFSRAVDFGYSKNPEETFAFWGKEAVLADVVFVIRKFQPHLIITRFPPDGRGGHGHHTASAILAEEAFDLSNDPNAFPEQLQRVSLWQPEALYWNASSWWDKDLPNKAQTDPTIVEVEVGGYDPILGRSCNELASLSRSMHKSQGFGIPMARGEMKEYLEFRKGNNAFFQLLFPEPSNDLELASLLETAANQLLMGQREEAIQQLFRYKEQGLNQETAARVDRIIAGILGIYMEVNAPNWFAAQGETINAQMECLLRLAYPVRLESVSWNGKSEAVEAALVCDQTFSQSHPLQCNQTTNPYWLEAPFDALFQVPDSLVGFPQNPLQPFVAATFSYQGKPFTIQSGLQYKWTDRVQGELTRPMIVAPEVTVNFNTSSLVTTGEFVKLSLAVKAWKSSFSNNLRFDLPEGWKVKPAFVPIDIPDAGGEQVVEVTVLPPSQTTEGKMLPVLDGVQQPLRSSLEIHYPHIVQEVLFLPSELKLANAHIVIDPGVVGYIEGAGDEVPEALRRMGFQVEMLDEQAIRNGSLDQYLAIVAGIRAYNTNEWLPSVQDILMEYVDDGGNYIVQYNTLSRDLKLDSFGPFPMKLSRERVSDETAVPKWIDPTHGVFKRPNVLSMEDFNGWVQERGLYFADTEGLDPAYQPLISWNDSGEPPRLGGLIVAHYGEGSFMYTGISFFRQLPAAVPGAYRLLANMVCYEP